MTRAGLLPLFDKYGILPTPQRIEIAAILPELPRGTERDSIEVLIKVRDCT